MTLARSTRLGPYEIVGPLGAGGMGEVYRARDTRLGREVAVKVLPAEVARDFDRLRRFEQEAKTVSALNHPHIVTLHEVGQSEHGPYLVLEMVEGRSLRMLLRDGALPVKRVFQLGAQIAEGLAKAHAAGIVHRDLKPENVMVTDDGFAKILDFGLAKLVYPGIQDGHAAETMTLVDKTASGAILGTLGYLSPEQAMGRAADSRSDQFALGLLLYEMATGDRPFHRETVPESLTAVIREQPAPLRSKNAALPEQLGWIVERCLAKDPDERYASTRDLARDLADALGRLSVSAGATEASAPAGASLAVGRRPRIVTMAAAFLLLAAGLGAGLWLRRPSERSAPSITTLTYSGHDYSPTVSPDGSFLAFTSMRDGISRIWLKQLKSGEEIAITSGADAYPRFSPDGSSILFTRTEEGVLSLYRIPSIGGEPRRLVTGAIEGDWSPDGREIVFVQRDTGSGSTVSRLGLARADGSGAHEILRSERLLYFARFSPDGESVVVASGSQAGTPGELLVFNRRGELTRALPTFSPNTATSQAEWLGRGDALLYLQAESAAGSNAGSASNIVLQDLRSGRARSLYRSPWSGQGLGVVADGRIVFGAEALRQNLRTADLRVSEPQRSGHWLTRGASADRQPVYSPDGKWIVFSSDRSGNLDLWAIATDTGALRRLTDDPADDWDPGFVRSGSQLLWSSNRGGHFEIWSAGPDGSNARQVSRDGVDAENPTATPDGSWIVYNSGNPGALGIWKVRADGSQATLLAAGQTNTPEVSPDGEFVLYRINPGSPMVRIRVVRLRDGAPIPFEIRVDNRRFPSSAGRARWSPDGREIIFLGEDEEGATGVYTQVFLPGADTRASRRKLAGFDRDIETESFGISPDGARLVLAQRERLSTLMLIDHLEGVRRPLRSR